MGLEKRHGRLDTPLLPERKGKESGERNKCDDKRKRSMESVTELSTGINKGRREKEMKTWTEAIRPSD